jgi:twinfilin-like protein
MVYSSGASSVFQKVKSLLSSSSSIVSPRKIESTDPKELTEEFLIGELGFGQVDVDGINGNAKTSFARPKGPGRRR